jgi:hypothetical protein
VKVTRIVQLVAGPNVAGNVVAHVPPDLANPAPLVAMLVTVSGPVPVLLRLTVCAALALPTFWLPNAPVLGATKVSVAAGVVPVPVSGILMAGPVVSLAMVTLADLAPADVGTNRTVTEQLAPVAKTVTAEQLPPTIWN